jgi:hypothetical protein
LNFLGLTNLLDHPGPRPLSATEFMAVQVNIAEAKAKLSSLLSRALAGEEIIIARAGVFAEYGIPVLW